MKTFFKKSIYLFILLGLTISLNSCNDDDDTNPETITFLEKYDQTKWLTVVELVIEEGSPETIDFDLYAQIDKDPTKFLTFWAKDLFEPCYEKGIVNMEEVTEGESFKIIENSEEKLSIEVTDEDGVETVTFTVTNNVLKMETTFIEDGETETEALLFNTTDVDLATLEICPEEV